MRKETMQAFCTFSGKKLEAFMDKPCNHGFYSKLIYNEKQKQLELNGYPLQHDERIEIEVLHNWLAGSVQQDRGGWYLTTDDAVDIRLRAGLTARRPHHVPIYSHSPDNAQIHLKPNKQEGFR
jgi:hypothetical protein